jgi:hypothetical protein
MPTYTIYHTWFPRNQGTATQAKDYPGAKLRLLKFWHLTGPLGVF